MDNPDSGDARIVSLADKVAFMLRPGSYARAPRNIELRETHMSFVFLTEDKVYKLKKPVFLSYLNFSTLARREAACRAELTLNRRLASDTYLDVVPIRLSTEGLSIGGKGKVVDWLVVMRRLEDDRALDRAIASEHVTVQKLSFLVAKLSRFFRHTRPVPLSADAYLLDLRRNLAFDEQFLLRSQFELPTPAIRNVAGAQRLYLHFARDELIQRVRDRRIRNGHGDLRPEHIYLDGCATIIDCLEFNDKLRRTDPFDELAYLSLECERLGAAWIGEFIRRGVTRTINDDPEPALFLFYRCHRAMLRARLAIAHLLEPSPRTPEKWPRQARAYLTIAARDARQLRYLIRTPTGRKGDCHRAGGLWSRR